MKTPVMLSLSAVVALGHWLVLAPGPDTLARLAAPAGSASAVPAAPAAAAVVQTFETGRLERAAPASLQAFTVLASAPTALAPSPSNTAAEAAKAAAQTKKAKQAERDRAEAAKAAAEAAQASGASAAATERSQRANAGDAAVEPVQASSNAAMPSATNASAQSSSAGVESTASAQNTAPSQVTSLAAGQTQALPAEFLARVQLPQPGRVNYDISGQVRGLQYRAAAVLEWQQDGKRYDARMVATAFLVGSRTLHSAGEVTSDGLAPTRFGDKTRSEQAAHFQPEKGKITFSANTPDAAWQRGAQDRLSVFFQLAGILSGQPDRFVAGTLVPVFTASARAAQTWAFQVDGREMLNLPAGEMPALKLSRPAQFENDQLVEIWFAPSLAYWPVRIKLTQRNGDFVDQQLASLPAP